MNELEETAVAFFRAIRATGRECIGHDNFGFKMDVNTMTPMEDKAKALVFNEKLQQALTIASDTTRPVHIEGTSLQ